VILQHIFHRACAPSSRCLQLARRSAASGRSGSNLQPSRPAPAAGRIGGGAGIAAGRLAVPPRAARPSYSGPYTADNRREFPFRKAQKCWYPTIPSGSRDALACERNPRQGCIARSACTCTHQPQHINRQAVSGKPCPGDKPAAVSATRSMNRASSVICGSRSARAHTFWRFKAGRRAEFSSNP